MCIDNTKLKRKKNASSIMRDASIMHTYGMHAKIGAAHAQHDYHGIMQDREGSVY